MTAWGRWLVVLALLPIGGYALAADDAARARRIERRDARREEMFRMVDAYIAMNIEEKLGLTDEQFAKVLPLFKRLQADRRRFAAQRTEIIRDMRERLQNGAATEGQIGISMKELKSLEDEEPSVLRKDRDAVDQVLTVVQQAKLRVLEIEVERKIRTLTQRPGADGPARRPAPAGGDD